MTAFSDWNLGKDCKAIVILFAAAVLVAGCGDDSEEETENADGAAGQEQTVVVASLSLSGSMPKQVLIDTPVDFRPVVNNPNDVSVSFSVENLPSWAELNASTGRITGTPSAGDVGIYQGVRLTASGNGETATLGPYNIEVVAVGTGRATLTWSAPVENVDGSPLLNLAGFRIYYGPAQESMTRNITINNASVSTYIVENLTPATWYFAATAFDADGYESAFSNIAIKIVTE